MRFHKKIILIIVSLCLLTFIITKYNRKSPDKGFNVKIKSGNLSTDYNIYKALEDIEKFRLNTVNIPVVINIDNLSSSQMSIDENSKERAIQLIKKLKKQNINIILEPYPWIDNGSEYETDWNPDNINDFFWNWRVNVLQVLIEDIAIPYNIDILNIGTSFNHMEYAEGYWLDLIENLRKNYTGLITYRTSWWVTAKWDMDTYKVYEEKLNNKLFSKVDFISIAAYFELTNKDTNSLEDLMDSIYESKIYGRGQNIKEEIENFYKKWDKPIFFGELGFPRTIRASVHPWDPFQSQVIDNMEQANCFAAYQQVFEKEPWFLGFSVFSIGEDSDDKLYYPSDASMEVIRDWYE